MTHISTLLDRAKRANTLAIKLQTAYGTILVDKDRQAQLATMGLTPDDIGEASRAIQDLSDLIEETVGNVEIQWPPRYTPPKNT